MYRYCFVIGLGLFIGIWMRKAPVSLPITPLSSPKKELEIRMQEPTAAPTYPWDDKRTLSPITKEYFRCKGSSLNPPIPIFKDGKVVDNAFDCNGATSHSLPLRHGKEFIYPILIDLLNEIQEATGKSVIITSGHRCPSHNQYLSFKNQASKHQIGAEITFYVADLEHHPEIVLNVIIAFYRTNPKYAKTSIPKQAEELDLALSESSRDSTIKTGPILEYEARFDRSNPEALANPKSQFFNSFGYTQFQRYEKSTDVSIKPWFNKEIFIKLYQPHEGRTVDNSHQFPYFSIQVRFDTATNMPVAYSWKEAQNFLRYS